MRLSKEFEAILRDKAKQYGIPYAIVYSVVGSESTFDNTLVGDGGNSFGLFQINKPSHPDFDVSRYKDIEYQSDYQLPELKRYYDKGVSQGLQGVALAQYVEKYGQRPVWTDTVANNISTFYTEITGSSVNSVVQNNTSSSSGYTIPSWLESITEPIAFYIVFVVFIIIISLGTLGSIYQITK